MDGLEIDTEFNGDNIEDSIGFFHDDLGPLAADNDEQSKYNCWSRCFFLLLFMLSLCKYLMLIH